MIVHEWARVNLYLSPIHHRTPDSLRPERNGVSPLIFKPERAALSQPEEDAALQVQRRFFPSGSKLDFPIIRDQADQDGGDKTT